MHDWGKPCSFWLLLSSHFGLKTAKVQALNAVRVEQAFAAQVSSWGSYRSFLAGGFLHRNSYTCRRNRCNCACKLCNSMSHQPCSHDLLVLEKVLGSNFKDYDKGLKGLKG